MSPKTPNEYWLQSGVKDEQSFTINVPAPEANRLREMAQREGLTVLQWITRLVARELWTEKLSS